MQGDGGRITGNRFTQKRGKVYKPCRQMLTRMELSPLPPTFRIWAHQAPTNPQNVCTTSLLTPETKTIQCSNMKITLKLSFPTILGYILFKFSMFIQSKTSEVLTAILEQVLHQPLVVRPDAQPREGQLACFCICNNNLDTRLKWTTSIIENTSSQQHRFTVTKDLFY